MSGRALLIVSLGAWSASCGASCAEDTLVMARSGLWSDSLNGHEHVNIRTPRVPLYGASFASKVRGVATTVTGMYGQASDTGSQRSERLNGEITVTSNTNQQFGFAVGYRYERAKDHTTGPTRASAETELHSGRIGFVGSSPLFDDERHRIVTGFYVAGGSQTSESSTPGAHDGSRAFAGPEVVVAYVATLRERYVIDVRYRAALYASDFDRASRSQTQSALFFSIGRRFG